MFKKLVVLICLVTTLNSSYASSQELGELTITLNQLENLNSKFITPIKTKTIARYPLPDAEFYKNLEKSLVEAFNGNSSLLDGYGDNPPAQVAKYMFSISNEIVKEGAKATNILLLVQLFDRVQAKYNTSDKIIITSVSTGDAAKEKILLKTLYHFGYSSITFYAIDPVETTKKALEKFKEDPELKQYKYKQFADTKFYVKEIIEDQKELPNVCLTYFPNLYMNAGSTYEPGMHNECNDRSKNHNLSTTLILPQYFDELGIITSDQEIIKSTNQALAKMSDITFAQVKQRLPNILHQPYRCEQNVVLNFLEIIKLASSTNNDCIAYYKSGKDIDTYYNIASKSIAQLYFETSSLGSSYAQFKVDLKQFKLWSYNQQTNQFERKVIK